MLVDIFRYFTKEIFLIFFFTFTYFVCLSSFTRWYLIQQDTCYVHDAVGNILNYKKTHFFFKNNSMPNKNASSNRILNRWSYPQGRYAICIVRVMYVKEGIHAYGQSGRFSFAKWKISYFYINKEGNYLF